MKKVNVPWTISTLQEVFENIEFPEFQREPTVWPLYKKQLLIDSIFRGLDISTIYLFRLYDEDGPGENGDGQAAVVRYECIDGRQRINAILSFLGLNESGDPFDLLDLDNNFPLKSSNEISLSDVLEDVNGKTFVQLKNDPDADDDQYFLNYTFNVLEITEVANDDELNLMFLRLQGGSNLNPGEKLRAMKGDMRNFIFGVGEGEPGLGKHPFFAYLSIPERRYAREQVAVQIAMNYYSREIDNEFHRGRFVDLQEFLGTHVVFDDADDTLTADLKEKLDQAYEALSNAEELKLRNRAIGLTTFFFISDLIDEGAEGQVPQFLEFLKLFLPTLKEQVGKGIEIDPEYRDLLTFQTYVSQAAVEKYAIENRQKFLTEYFEYFKETGEIKKTEIPA
jgi:hypothetical protein